MPNIAGMLEIVDWGLYDSVGIPQPSPDAEMPPAFLFVNPLGLRDRHPVSGRLEVKSWTETNMYESRQLPTPCKFLVKAIRAALIDTAGNLMPVGEYSRFYRATVLRFVIASKLYADLPLFKFADPAVLFSSSQVFGEFLQVLTRDERADFVRALRKTLEPGLIIETQQAFHVELRFDQAVKWDGPTSPAGAIVILEGAEARAIQ